MKFYDFVYDLVHFKTCATTEETLVLMNNDYMSQEPQGDLSLQASVAIARAAYERKHQLKRVWDLGLNVVGLS